MGLPTDLGEQITEDLSKSDVEKTCGFCGKTQHEVKVMIAGPIANICNECVELSVALIREEKDPMFCHDKIMVEDLQRTLENLARKVLDEEKEKEKKDGP